jgi:hypothetical protein
MVLSFSLVNNLSIIGIGRLFGIFKYKKLIYDAQESYTQFLF